MNAAGLRNSQDVLTALKTAGMTENVTQADVNQWWMGKAVPATAATHALIVDLAPVNFHASLNHAYIETLPPDAHQRVQNILSEPEQESTQPKMLRNFLDWAVENRFPGDAINGYQHFLRAMDPEGTIDSKEFIHRVFERGFIGYPALVNIARALQLDNTAAVHHAEGCNIPEPLTQLQCTVALWMNYLQNSSLGAVIASTKSKKDFLLTDPHLLQILAKGDESPFIETYNATRSLLEKHGQPEAAKLVEQAVKGQHYNRAELLSALAASPLSELTGQADFARNFCDRFEAWYPIEMTNRDRYILRSIHQDICELTAEIDSMEGKKPETVRQLRKILPTCLVPEFDETTFNQTVSNAIGGGGLSFWQIRTLERMVRDMPMARSTHFRKDGGELTFLLTSSQIPAPTLETIREIAADIERTIHADLPVSPVTQIDTGAYERHGVAGEEKGTGQRRPRS